MPAVRLNLSSLRVRLLLGLCAVALSGHAGSTGNAAIDYASFLASHDMTWNRVPDRWELAPFSGNGDLGFLLYQNPKDAPNTLSIHPGRHDYYDHRIPKGGAELLWINRCRLPLGRFQVECKGDIQHVAFRLDLWNAELTGRIETSEGFVLLRGLTHATRDVLYVEVDAAGGEAVHITWHPEEPVSHVRRLLEMGQGPTGGTWDLMRSASYPYAPLPSWYKREGITYCLQPLHQHRGETATGWRIRGTPSGKQVLTASIVHSFPEKNSVEGVKTELLEADRLLKEASFFSSHRAWWHDYYAASFLSLNDPELEAFYWIQMYKLGSAMRGDGPLLDLMGPWYHDTLWPMVWGDLRLQASYWTPLTANRLGLAASLPDNLDLHATSLARNVPRHWKDSMSIGYCFPQDLQAHGQGTPPDMLAWILHNYWLVCAYAGDRERMRDGLFPLLKKTVNGYRNYMEDHPVSSPDGRIHLKKSWSPEYPEGVGQDMNFSLGLLRWACQTLVDLEKEHSLQDPDAREWQDLLDRLVDFQVDDNGLRVGRDIAFDRPHHRYSHLIAFYPLFVIDPGEPGKRELLRRSLDHWLEVTLNATGEQAKIMNVCGYTSTGAASMYAALGEGEKALEFLRRFLGHKRLSPTTMLAEPFPVIEGPLTLATSLHDMLLQSWDGRIRVFPAVPASWSEIRFQQLRAQGAFLISAKRTGGQTEFVRVESLKGLPCRVKVDLSSPRVFINGRELEEEALEWEKGFLRLPLQSGDTAVLGNRELSGIDQTISPLPVPPPNRNVFGLNEKTRRLPGHRFYRRGKE